MPLNFNFNSNKKDIKLGKLIDSTVKSNLDLTPNKNYSRVENSTSVQDVEVMDFEVDYSSENALTSNDPNDFYREALNWGIENGIIRSKNGDFFKNGQITSIEFADMLYGLAGRPDFDTSDAENYFKDLDITNKYYYSAMWAHKHNLYLSMFEHRFEPDKTLSRTDLLYLLYRFIGNESISVSERNYVVFPWATKIGLLPKNYENNGPLTREETITILYKFNDIYHTLQNSQHPNSKLQRGNSPSFNKIYNNALC